MAAEHEVRSECAEKFAVQENKISHLEKGNEAIMQDIRDIKSDITTIKENMAKMDGSIKNLGLEVKVWVLGGIVVGLLGLAGTIFMGIRMFGDNARSLGSAERQIEVNTGRLDKIEGLHLNNNLREEIRATTNQFGKSTETRQSSF